MRSESVPTLPDIETLFPRVDEKLGKHQWDTAKAMLEEMHDHYGDHAEIFKRLGMIHSQSDEFEKTFSAFEKATELGGNSEEIGQLAFLILASKDNKIIESHFPRLREIFSEEGFLSSLTTLIERTMVIEDWETAKKWCQKGVEWFPDNAHIFLLASKLMLQTHHTEASAQFIDRALELAPDRTDLMSLHSQIHQQLQKIPKKGNAHTPTLEHFKATLPSSLPIERMVSFQDHQLYFSMPGSMENIFYALPILRKIIQAQHQNSGVLITSPACAPLETLLKAQPYISDFLVDTETVYVNDTAVQPYTVLPSRPNCFNLGFRPYLMHSKLNGYSETLAILFKIPYIDRDEQHLLVTPEVKHRFDDERYVVVCPESLDSKTFSETFWKEAIQKIQQRFPVVLLGGESSQPFSEFRSEKIENLIGKKDLLETAGILKKSACFFGTPSIFYHIARNVGIRPFAFTDAIPPQRVLAPNEIFQSQQLPEAILHLIQMP